MLGGALLAALLGPGALPAPSLGIDVTSCGQQVPSGERGDLLANLSCDVGVHLGAGARSISMGSPGLGTARSAARECSA